MLHRDSITHINPSLSPIFLPTLSAPNIPQKQLNEWKEKASTSQFQPKKTKDQPASPRGHNLTPLCRQLSPNRICQRERKNAPGIKAENGGKYSVSQYPLPSSNKRANTLPFWFSYLILPRDWNLREKMFLFMNQLRILTTNLYLIIFRHSTNKTREEEGETPDRDYRFFLISSIDGGTDLKEILKRIFAFL